MATEAITRDNPRVRAPRHDCCKDDCPSGTRNHYFRGKQLTPDSYFAEQNYSIERRRLINRAVLGHGVVYGFALAMRDSDGAIPPGELQVGAGVAFDIAGRELIQACSTRLSLEHLLVLDEHHRPLGTDHKLDDRFQQMKPPPSNDDCWLLSAHYAERKIGPVTIPDPCRCERQEWDQICETVVYSIERIKCEECCAERTCELHCCCPPDGSCCADDPRRKAIDDKREELLRTYNEELAAKEHTRSQLIELEQRYAREFDDLAEAEVQIPSRDVPRGGCSCLCTDTTNLKVGTDCMPMEDVGDCTRADLANGVALACVKLHHDDECKRWAISAIEDACGPRTELKRNDLLFDLVQGCDLTRIEKTGWAKWHRRSTPPVPFEEFMAALGWTSESADDEYPTRDFWVSFSRPVRVDTLTPDAFVMAVMGDHEDDYWRRYYRVPILAVDTDQVPPKDGDPPGHVRSAKLVVWSRWLRNSFVDDDSIFGQGHTRVEIEVRGDLIIDCLGQQLDANARGRLPFPSGNRSPGGTYLSSFTVGPRLPAAPPPAPAPQQPPSPPRPRRQSNRVR